MAGALYIVATPLGNLEDISARALKVLGSVRTVYCEDTRRTRRLLTHFEIHTRVDRYRDRDPRGLDKILTRLGAGDDLALASDAGTPVLSDPGLTLVSAARREGITVIPVPGPFAAAAAVAASGLPGDAFVFLGFLPRSPSKQHRALAAAATLGKTIVLYESPYRIRTLLRAAETALGPSAQAAVCRELSKVHEEWLTGTVAAVRAVLEERGELLGEFTAVFHPEKR